MALLLWLLLFGGLLVPSAARAPTDSAAPTVQVTLGVVLPERNLSSPFAWPRVSPALSLALEALQPQLSHDGLVVHTAFVSAENEDGACDPQAALRRVLALKFTEDPDVLLGLGCLETSSAVAALVRSWQVPLLVSGAYQRDGDSSLVVVNAGPVSPRDFVAFLGLLGRHFSWTHRAVVVVSPSIEYRMHFPYLSYAVRAAASHNFTAGEHVYREPGEAVLFIQKEATVVYLCGSLEIVQKIMHLALAQNMTNGDYVFFYLDPFGESLRAERHREAAKPWQSTENQDTGGLREAFQMVLVIAPHEPQTPEYQHFQSQLVLRAQRDFGVAINDSLGHLVASCYHDGLLLYLRALNETLNEGGTKKDTSRILEKMRSLKFHGVTGWVSINSNNDREMDYDLWAMGDVESGEFQVVGHYIASEERINWTGPIHWKKGHPPLDNPSCVFNMDDLSCDIKVP